MADAIRLPLELFYEREARHPNKRYMVQPLSGGQLLELSWAEVGEQARRAASWLRSRELPPGSRVAIVSKNCVHWIIADLAIWMAGCVSVPLYPNLTADSMRQVLEHSEATLAFIGKLDDMLGQRTSWDTAAFTQLVQASYIADAPWSSGELSKLKAQAAMGLPLEAMARALDRTRESVQSKLTELGLKASF